MMRKSCESRVPGAEYFGVRAACRRFETVCSAPVNRAGILFRELNSSWFCPRLGPRSARILKRRQAVRAPRDSGLATHRSSSGYLLFEVLLAMAILTIVVVLVFRIIESTVRSTLDVSYLQTKEEQADGLFELLRQNFVSLPQLTAFETREHAGATELIFRKAPFTFSYSGQGPQFGTIVLAARPGADGRLSLSVLQEPENASQSYLDSSSDAEPNWFVILPDLDQLSWRFYSGSASKWETSWPNPAIKPELVELTFKLSGDPRVQRGVFRWPVATSSGI